MVVGIVLSRASRVIFPLPAEKRIAWGEIVSGNHVSVNKSATTASRASVFPFSSAAQSSSGENYGTVWNDYTAAGDSLYPTGQTFAEWYEAWLDRVLVQLANIPLREHLATGMTREQVIAVMGDRRFEEWRREGVPGYGLLFENVPLDIRFNDDHTAQIVFDQAIVVSYQ
ncbi:MAG: hypothetical protein JXA21_02740 [Anaerolineae bacterium]|nr:hypothetical protein [Anaerolineae bacterium]